MGGKGVGFLVPLEEKFQNFVLNAKWMNLELKINLQILQITPIKVMCEGKTTSGNMNNDSYFFNLEKFN